MAPKLIVSDRKPQNVFWEVADSDPHRALSVDRLHVNHGGLFARHLWVEFRRIMGEMPRKARGVVEKQCVA